MSDPPDEFDWIAALRPLTRGEPAALGLMDDAAVLPARPGHDLVISEDAMVEGVHFLRGEDGAIVARRLLRTALSDLAAKAAEPFAYTLTVAWPPSRTWDDRLAFIRGLDEDGQRFDVSLLGGDTVSTEGPLVVSATVFGWVKAECAVPRSGAASRHALVVCGAIGDGYLGLKAARGEIADPGGKLAWRYRLPEPLLALRQALQTHASAAADVSDGLVADVLHLVEASEIGAVIDLERVPTSPRARAWLATQPDLDRARLELASGGDDYALVCAAADGAALVRAAEACGVPAAIVGEFGGRTGLEVRLDGRRLTPQRLGYRHR
ncbi:MAG TPA: thiamine-phosphate kinase [Caulobacteraceae bacterium]|jgi:thiamine-monophosphate kinase